VRKADLAYVAGLFDGEGCISIAKCKPRYSGCSPYYRLVVAVAMANEYIPRFLKFHFGGRVSKRNAPTERWKDQWQWHLGSDGAVAFLKAILPYLKLKREEAELAIEFQSNKRVIFERKSANALAIEEAQRLLLAELKDKSAMNIIHAKIEGGMDGNKKEGLAPKQVSYPGGRL
jgi:hypothetical protein